MTSSTTQFGPHRAIAPSADDRDDIPVAGPVASERTGPVLGPVAVSMSTGSIERSCAWSAGVPAPTLSEVQWESFFDGLAQARSTETAEGHPCKMLRAPPGLLSTWSGYSAREELPRLAAPPVLRSPRSWLALRSVQALDASGTAAPPGTPDVTPELFTATLSPMLRPRPELTTEVPPRVLEPIKERPVGVITPRVQANMESLRRQSQRA
ncbi:hypothetical protein [uncultured Marinobacter sp.]|uniref:hypothetical protein n=1 Tax=uncultured Marinobacter sp. TaxID=187379 RepID=UPI002597B4CF|nr:hypothetical protein [uncultured Marinobacter sp.]